MTLQVGIVAGEHSGDLLGGLLMNALRDMHSDIRFVGIGGEHMLAAGVESLYPMEAVNTWGVDWNVIRKLRHTMRIHDGLIRHFTRHPPDLFIGVDLAEFNLLLEHRLRRKGCKTVHYSAPTLIYGFPWLIHLVKKSTDLMLCIFPFEQAIYKEHGIAYEYIGHPLADILSSSVDQQAARTKLGLKQQRRLIALLPGSRDSEIERITPICLQVAVHLKKMLDDVAFATAQPDLKKQQRVVHIKEQIAPELECSLHPGGSRGLLEACDFVILAPGTVSLEAMILGRPMVSVFRTNWFNTMLVRRCTGSIGMFSLPNVLANERLIPEYLNLECQADRIAEEVAELLSDKQRSEVMRQRFTDLSAELQRDACKRAATAIIHLLE